MQKDVKLTDKKTKQNIEKKTITYIRNMLERY